MSPKEEKREGQETEPGRASRGGQGGVVSSSEYLASFYIVQYIAKLNILTGFITYIYANLSFCNF